MNIDPAGIAFSLGYIKKRIYKWEVIWEWDSWVYRGCTLRGHRIQYYIRNEIKKWQCEPLSYDKYIVGNGTNTIK